MYGVLDYRNGQNMLIVRLMQSNNRKKLVRDLCLKEDS